MKPRADKLREALKSTELEKTNVKLIEVVDGLYKMKYVETTVLDEAEKDHIIDKVANLQNLESTLDVKWECLII